MNKKNNRKGFTIVELVIVIAVIAILATVLVPTFGNVIEKANITAAKQEAKALFTNYVTVAAESGAYVDDCYVVVDGYYVEIVDGGVTEATPSQTAPTTCYNKLENGTITLVTVDGCAHNGCHK